MAETTQRPLRVFLCHASVDKPAVRALYKRLIVDGVDAWLDEEKLVPGQKWGIEIPKAVRNSDIVIICLSEKSVSKEGYVQREIKFALDMAAEKPDDTIFIIPARLNNCEVPETLSAYMWVDIFNLSTHELTNYEKLLIALKMRAAAVGATIQPIEKKSSEERIKEASQNLPVLDFGDSKIAKFLSRFRTKHLLCPYCIEEIRYSESIKECPNCKSELPLAYVNNFSKYPPVFMQIIGLSGAGKTTYLQTLALMIENMTNFWPDFASRALTESTLSFMRDIRDYRTSGKLPEPTPLGLRDIFMLNLINMERWGNRTLIVRDVAGEFFSDVNFPLKYMPYLLHIPSLFLMGSLADIKIVGLDNINALMSSYIYTLGKHDQNINKINRTIVIILSKADTLFEELPSNVQQYLRDDPFKIVANQKELPSFVSYDVKDYINRLIRTSNALEAWVSNISGGQMLVSNARHNNINLRFAIVSSLGENNHSDLMTRPVPQRILDPLFWALDLQSL